MGREHGRGFLPGMLLGMSLSLILGVVGIYLLDGQDALALPGVHAPRIQALTNWITRNFGWSLIPFGITLGLYLDSLVRLKRRLADARPLDEINQSEHLTDVWISLFFGIGVIWTAIGMRGALLYALGDPSTAAESGAFAVLQRLVDGGILTALSTTILGGAGGYLMRVIKGVYLGARLNRFYGEQDRHHTARIEYLLGDIRTSLGGLATGSASTDRDHTSSNAAQSHDRHGPGYGSHGPRRQANR